MVKKFEGFAMVAAEAWLVKRKNRRAIKPNKEREEWGKRVKGVMKFLVLVFIEENSEGF